MRRPVSISRTAALASVWICLVSVLRLMEIDPGPWLALVLGASLGIVWVIADIVILEIEGRRRMRRDR